MTHQHLATPHDPALGAYEAAQLWADPSADDDSRTAAWCALMSLRCDHGDALVRRVITAAVEDAIATAIHGLALNDALDRSGSFTEPPAMSDDYEVCLWCGVVSPYHHVSCDACGESLG